MKTIVPINTSRGGVCSCILAHYAKNGWEDFAPYKLTPSTAVMEIITDNDMNEEAKVEQVGNYMDDSDRKFDNLQCGRVYSTEGLSPTINTCQGCQREPKILLDMEKPKSCASRQRGDKHNLETRKDDVANCVTSIDTDSMVAEPNPLLQKGAVIANTQLNCYRGTIEEPAPTVCAAGGMGGGHVAMMVEDAEPAVLTNRRTEEGKELRKQGIEEFKYRQLVPREDSCSGTLTSVQKDNLLQEPKARYRIRKLTEREVFRLMDVSEEDIDKIQAAGISKTAAYRIAGNSIVCSCLYHIFRKMFVQTECESQQLSLF